MEESIHGMQEYQSFQYKFTFSTTQAVFQLTYMTPTIVVMLKIFMSFRGPSHWNSAHTMNHHIYVIIMLYFLFICSKIMIISLPLLFLIPLCCTSFMIPALGYCRQMGSPLNYGATYIYYSGGWDGWRNSYIHLVMSIVMCSLTILCSVVMLFKLRQSVFSNSSARTKEQSKRAESSLSFTMISFIIPFINNTMLTIVYLTFPGWVYHMMIFRPFGNDCETVMMPWILYMTHPMFRRKRTISQSTAVTTIPRMNSPIMH
ncbi:Serpentine Receptor, class U [Caenorhabditis elegans]|uniref:Serpentine Receptor, class U n=1 Tax=Caenorhabditis elegans TaxID=6239 RepID=E0AHB6_CAEEL|nr:Serpentine Receptor, class U [Caenorhabditis elegans]CBW44389.1 Serpentine Receptor, class U [Caenorhabditis elegans]|eukprot:NP_001256144.1 Serpentine Receptor, class U [Caenorhabditis elegans]